MTETNRYIAQLLLVQERRLARIEAALGIEAPESSVIEAGLLELLHEDGMIDSLYTDDGGTRP